MDGGGLEPFRTDNERQCSFRIRFFSAQHTLAPTSSRHHGPRRSPPVSLYVRAGADCGLLLSPRSGRQRRTDWALALLHLHARVPPGRGHSNLIAYLNHRHDGYMNRFVAASVGDIGSIAAWVSQVRRSATDTLTGLSTKSSY
jgi:hypothetical protein